MYIYIIFLINVISLFDVKSNKQSNVYMYDLQNLYSHTCIDNKKRNKCMYP